MGIVVVGLDGSLTSRAAFTVAVNEAELKGHIVRAVHVYPYPVATIYQAMHTDIAEIQETAEAWVDRELADLEEQRGGPFPVDVEPVVRMGHAGAMLVEAAEEADLLVIGSRGLGGVRGLLLGSVSTYCTHHLPCAVLIVPSPETAE